jgi:hypothetical protein
MTGPFVGVTLTDTEDGRRTAQAGARLKVEAASNDTV